MGASRARVRACWQVLESGLTRLHGISLKGLRSNGNNAQGGGYNKERASLRFRSLERKQEVRKRMPGGSGVQALNRGSQTTQTSGLLV